MTMAVSTSTSNIEHDSARNALLWGTRIALGKTGDTLYRNRESYTPVSVNTGRVTSYANILGLDESISGKANFNRLKPTTVWQHMTSDNVNKGKLTASRYVKETLWRNNIHGITDFKNNPGSAISKGLGIGVLGFHVASQTKDGYEAAKAKHGDNSLTVAASTAGTLGISAAKAGITWEVSNVLYDVGRTTLPQLTVGKVPLGGVLLGAISAVMAARALDSVIPPPQAPGKASANSDATFTSVRQAIQPVNSFSTSPSAQGIYA